MRSSHNVHLSNKNMKCNTLVALQYGANKILVLTVKEKLIYQKL